MDDEWFCVVRTPRRAPVEDLALVLAAEQVPHVVRAGRTGWALLVPMVYVGAAAAVLAAHERDGLDARAEEPTFDDGDGPVASTVGVWVGMALLVFHAWVVLLADRPAWLRAGRASAQRILDDEPWRVITALTLHADPFHVVSNALSLAVFGGLLARAIGPAATLWVMLFSGGLGNYLNAAWREGVHLSIGASTAVFGVVGALGGLQAMRYRGVMRLSRRAWVPLAGAVALLAVLGASPESDFGAHVGGLLAGTGIGLAAPWLRPQLLAVARAEPTPWRSALGIAAAFALVAACWWQAWSHRT